MSFSKENVICVYRENDADSFFIANRYKTIYNLEDDQLVAIPCSNIEILSNYSDFQQEVENPIKQALLSEPVSNRVVYAIILMPYVPGGFREGSDIISSTSRLSRIYHSFQKNIKNITYNRQVFKRFDSEDSSFAIICTRIDGPNVVTNSWMDNIQSVLQNLQITGKFYLDAYSAYSFSDSSFYTNELVDFGNNYLYKLGMNSEKTVKTSSKDPFFSKINDDSFFWGWGLDRGSLGYFQSSSNTRAFFYNADFDGGLYIRDIDSRAWPILAIRQGYLASAGSLSGSDASSFLRPLPFMDALFRGATMGEAMLFSQPLLDSSVACFGDPLLFFYFPVSFEENTLISTEKSWTNMGDCYAKAIASIYRKSKILSNLRRYVASGDDEFVQEELIYLFDKLYAEFDDLSWKNDFIQLTKSYINFAVDRNASSYDFLYPNLNQYLLHTDSKIPKLILETLQDDPLINTISNSRIEITGSWVFDKVIDKYDGDFRFYHFELQVANEYEDFEKNEIIISKDTFSDVTNWYFEDYNGEFRELSPNGITSNYEGKKIRYISSSSELLQRGNFYWYRIRQKDELQEFDWKYYKLIVYL